MSAFRDDLITRLEAAADPARAPGQQDYMKSEMPFHGVATPETRASRNRSPEAIRSSTGGSGSPPCSRCGARPPTASRCTWPPCSPLIRRTAIGSTARSGIGARPSSVSSRDAEEVFLREAIGWALRQYARTDADEVIAFVERHEDRLSGRSKREALKHVHSGK